MRNPFNGLLKKMQKPPAALGRISYTRPFEDEQKEGQPDRRIMAGLYLGESGYTWECSDTTEQEILNTLSRRIFVPSYAADPIRGFCERVLEERERLGAAAGAVDYVDPATLAALGRDGEVY